MSTDADRRFIATLAIYRDIRAQQFVDFDDEERARLSKIMVRGAIKGAIEQANELLQALDAQHPPSDSLVPEHRQEHGTIGELQLNNLLGE